MVTDGGARQVRAYSVAGTLLGTAGGDGEGPGEFRSLGTPYRLPGDSLLVYDFSLRRLSVFDADLRFVRDFRLQQNAGDTPVSPAFVMGGTEIVARPGFLFGSATPTGTYRSEIVAFRFRVDGTLIDTIGRFPGDAHFVFTEEANSIAMVPSFRPRPRIAAAPDGFVYGNAERLEIGRYARNGRLLALLRGPDRAVPFTEERKRQFREETVAGASAGQRPFFEPLLAVIPMPDALPAWLDLAVDAEGQTWLRDFAWEDQDSVTWRVFSVEGVLTASLVMPGRLEVQAIGRDWVLGIWRDELGVESIRLYGLRR